MDEVAGITWGEIELWVYIIMYAGLYIAIRVGYKLEQETIKRMRAGYLRAQQDE
jgi:hypothetical protein